MGVHRDGEVLGLPPFESEMRRRVWWQIIGMDARYALFSGLSNSLLPQNWDSKEPSNINDTDLYPSATQSIQDKDGPTEMVFVILGNKVTSFKLRNPAFEPTLLLSDKMMNHDRSRPEISQDNVHRQVIEELNKLIHDTLRRFCDPNAGPVHEFTSSFIGGIVRKMGGLIAPKRWVGIDEGAAAAMDNAFAIAVKLLEQSVEHCERVHDKRFVWFSRLRFQIEVLAYVCGQLRYRQWGAYVDRAWRVVEQVYKYHPELMDMSQKTHSAIAVLLLKACTAREDAFVLQTGGVSDTPRFIRELRMLKPKVGVDNTQFSGSSTFPDLSSPIHNEAIDAELDNIIMADPSFDPQSLEHYLNSATTEW